MRSVRVIVIDRLRRRTRCSRGAFHTRGSTASRQSKFIPFRFITWQWSYIIPGVCLFVCLSVCLSVLATLRKTTDRIFIMPPDVSRESPWTFSFLYQFTVLSMAIKCIPEIQSEVKHQEISPILPLIFTDCGEGKGDSGKGKGGEGED